MEAAPSSTIAKRYEDSLSSSDDEEAPPKPQQSGGEGVEGKEEAAPTRTVLPAPQPRGKGDAYLARMRKRPKDEEEEDDDDDEDDSDDNAPAAKRSKQQQQQESDSEEESSSEEEDDGEYAGLFESREDRKRLMALPEIEREQILAERHEARLKRQQEEALESFVKQQRREEEKRAKRQAKKTGGAAAAAAAVKKKEEAAVAKAAEKKGGDDLFDDESGSEEEEESEAGEAAEESEESEEIEMSSSSEEESSEDEESEDEEGRRVTRGMASGETRRRARAARKRRSKAGDDDSSASESEASEAEGEEEKMGGAVKKGRGVGLGVDEGLVGAAPHHGRKYDELAPVASAQEMEKLQLKRHRLEKWVVEPWFKEAVVGGFVKANIDVLDGQPVHGYLLCEVIDVATGKSYNSGALRCDVYLKVAYGSSEPGTKGIGVPIRVVSNQPFGLEEHAKWVNQCRAQRVSMPTPDEAQAAVRRRYQLISGHQYTERDVTEMQEKRKKYQAGRSKKDAKAGLSRRKAELERNLEIGANHLQGARDRLDRYLREKAAEGLEPSEEEPTLKELREDVKREEGKDRALRTELAEVDRLLQEEAERVSRATKDWNALAEQIRRERFMTSVESAGGGAVASTLLPAALRKQAEKADPFQRQRTAPKVLWSVGTTPSNNSNATGGGAEGGQSQAQSQAPEEPTSPTKGDLLRRGAGGGACMEEEGEADPCFDPMAVVEHDRKALQRYMPKRPSSRKPVPRTERRRGLTLEEYHALGENGAEGGGGAVPMEEGVE